MNIILNKTDLDEMVSHYLTQDAFAFDVETIGTHRGISVINEVLWISFATHGRCDVIPMGHPNGDFVEHIFPLNSQGEKRMEKGLPLRAIDYSKDIKKAKLVFTEPPKQLFPAEVFQTLKPLLFNKNILKVGHNLLFDLVSVSKYYKKEIPDGPYFDTMVASFIYNNRNKGKLGLDDCLKRELGYEMTKGVGKEVEKHSFDEVAKYAHLDAKYTFLLWKTLQPKIEQDELTKVFKLEMDVLRVLCFMKTQGALIDVEALKELKIKLEHDIEKSKETIFGIAGYFNINSNREKQAILYKPKSEGGRGIKAKVLTGKGRTKEEEGQETGLLDYSVAAAALEQYRGSDELVDSILNYQDLNKLMSTYVIPYIGGEVIKTTNGKVRKQYRESLLINNRIHADFIQTGADTGRFSSRNPNLQNVPAPYTEHGKAIRNLFIAPPGHKLVVADYSQIEPRIIASMSGDPIMIKNYVTHSDIYTTVGETVGVDRKAGKVLVLSIAYGVGPDKIARQIGCTITRAKQLLDEFSSSFPKVIKYKQIVVAATKKQRPPYVETLLGRRRYLPEIFSTDPAIKAGAERQAFNTRIQGSAADIIKVAMVRAHAMLPKESHLLLTVHDELVSVCPDSLVDESVDAIRNAMEGINVLQVPLVADIKVVQKWGEAK